MARDLDLKGTLSLQGGDKVQDQLEEIADSAEKLEEPVNIRFRGDTDKVAKDIDDVLKKVDRLAGTDAANLQLTSNASKIAKEIAGLSLELEELDSEDITIDAKIQNIRDLEDGLDKLSAKAKEINGQEINLRTEGGRKGFDDVVNGADQAKSAVANMVGNASQDMGELVGVTGSAGVAVGQLAEYFTDTAFKAKAAGQGIGDTFKTFATAAGPIAAISAGIFLVTEGITAYQAPAKRAAEVTKQLGEAMAEGGDDSLAFAEVMRQNASALSDFIADANDPLGGFGTWVDEVMSKVPLIGSTFKQEGVNIFDALSQAGESMYSFGSAIDKGGQSTEAFRARLQAAKDAGQITGDQFNAVSEALDNYAGSAEDAAKMSAAMAVSGDEVAAMLADIAAQADPLSVLPGVWRELEREISNGTSSSRIATDAVNQLSAALGKPPAEILQIATDHMKDLGEAALKAAEAAHEYAQVMASDAWATSSVDAATQAYQRLGEQQFANVNALAGAEAAYDSFGEAIKKNGMNFDVATEAGRANSDQLQQLYSSLIPALSQAYADADGNQVKFQTNMNKLSTETMRKLQTEAGLTAEQAGAVISQLGAFDDSTYGATFELLGTEDANAKLALLSGVLGSLSEPVQKQVTLAILAGDPQGALDIIGAAVGAPGAVPPAVVGIEPGKDSATPAIDNVTGGDYNAEVNVGSETSEANKGIDAVKTKGDSTKPIVKVDSDTAQAIGTMMLLYAIARALQPVVTVKAVLGEYPSAASIASRIGTVRVPVDAYVRTMPRINGNGP